MDILVANNISKSYANHQALNDVSIHIPKGAIFGLLGPNGAGKTTFIRIVNQIIGKDQGEIFLNGEKLAPKHIYEIGYLPEERGLYRKMKVGEVRLKTSREVLKKKNHDKTRIQPVPNGIFLFLTRMQPVRKMNYAGSGPIGCPERGQPVHNPYTTK